LAGVAAVDRGCDGLDVSDEFTVPVSAAGTPTRWLLNSELPAATTARKKRCHSATG
jgi:hypothetical protein